jgi:alpha-amylase
MKRLKTTNIVKVMVMLFAFQFSMLSAYGQGWPDNYGGVMLQGFYWDSFKDTRWVLLEQQANDLAASFDLIWIPQSGNCGSQSMGYDDLWWFNDYNSSFGNEAQLRSMIQTFKAVGLGTIADVVINHRRNLSNWVDFPKESWNGEEYEMVSTDICANDDGGATKKWATSNGYSVSGNNDTGEGWDGMRDLDHKSENVQRIVKAYLSFLLNDLGYTGFRYDMVKGYSASYTKLYNEDSKPQFSVGECWDSSNTIRKWIDGTEKTSAAFDFQFRYTVRNACNNGNWQRLSQQNEGNWPLVSSNFSSGGYRQYAVTFVENHDTEKRSNAAQDPLKKDTLAANAYMIAMPGTPCVFLKHWQAYREEIKAMIAARKLAGITNMSAYESVANNTKYYANSIDGKLLVVVGDEKQVAPGDGWTKILSGYHYAYYLAKSLETAWVNKGSGDFSEAFDVELTAVSDAGDAQLVYTLDGSEPSATNGTACESGTVVRIEDTATLKVGLLVNGAVSGVVTRSYTYREAVPSEVVIPDFCTVGEGEVCAFFEAPTHWTNTVYCWAWTDSPSDNFTGGNWPGVACELLGTAANGNSVWKWMWDGKKQKGSAAAQPQKIIFNNNDKPQTDDLAFTQAGYYNEEGLQGVVTATAITAPRSQESGVRSQEAGARSLEWFDLQGRRLNGVPTRKGIYIYKGKKAVIK